MHPTANDSAPHPALQADLRRLKTNYASRRADPRPVPYSVATAYRMLIKEKERQARH